VENRRTSFVAQSRDARAPYGGDVRIKRWVATESLVLTILSPNVPLRDSNGSHHMSAMED
jgi:hypothetical protein